MALEAWTSQFWKSEIAIDKEYDESLELIHTDVCGSIDPASLGKNKYFLLFIDDYSRKTGVYFLKQKSKVFSTFRRFKALVEKQSGYHIKAMRSDRGGVFIFNDQQSKGYKLYNPVDNKIKISRDVISNEKSSWEWIDQDKEQYFFYPIDMDRKGVEEDLIEPMTPSSPASPTQSSPTLSVSSTKSRVKIGPRGKRSLEEIYDLNQNQSMFCLFVDTEPINFDEASRSENWRKAMNEEINAIKKNDTWELTTHQSDKKPIGVKWVCKVKKNSKGEVERYNIRLVVKGYKQRARIEYDEVFAPVTRLEMI
ncbi:hypothetical protein RJ639_007172 [Escallonia herrerae]|uniref:Uncharacterized protein n=1 Tax=Escallonia herrerae TaxID=1293975 RepID=A0AA89AUD2_9ASTE|nr:hypothetical protein RJ639_007172 [Escallonia herrerae]